MKSLLSFILLLCFTQFAQAADASLYAIRFGVHGAHSRIVLELSREIDYRLRLTSAGDEIQLSLSHLQDGNVPASGAGRGLIRDYRRNSAQDNNVDYVFRLHQPGKILRDFYLANPNGDRVRLVVDIGLAAADSSPPELGLRPPPDLSAPVAGFSLPRAILDGASHSSDSAVHAAPAVPLPQRKPDATRRPRVVVIDPGHGGIDPGAIGPGGVREKDITLAVASVLAQKLRQSGRYQVTLTRDKDTSLRLRQRVEIARKAGAELFISLHADSIDEGGVRGASIYTLSEKASDREAEQLAQRENQADTLIGLELQDAEADIRDILIDLAQRETKNQSRQLAVTLIQEMRAGNIRLLNNPKRAAGFAVLTAPDIPSILLEMGFISSPKEARLLTDPAHHRRLATALLAAIDRYFAAAAKP